MVIENDLIVWTLDKQHVTSSFFFKGFGKFYFMDLLFTVKEVIFCFYLFFHLIKRKKDEKNGFVIANEILFSSFFELFPLVLRDNFLASHIICWGFKIWSIYIV